MLQNHKRFIKLNKYFRNIPIYLAIIITPYKPYKRFLRSTHQSFLPKTTKKI